MSKYSKNNKVSEKTEDDALKVARANQRPGQTKEQTKLIAQGIQKGIEQYKKKHKAKSRELDKKLKKNTVNEQGAGFEAEICSNSESRTTNIMPWILLILTWLGFATYLYVFK